MNWELVFLIFILVVYTSPIWLRLLDFIAYIGHICVYIHKRKNEDEFFITDIKDDR